MDVISTCLRSMQEQQYEEVIIEESALLINSLWCIRDNSTILNIIDTADVNVKNPHSHLSPLHLAVNRKSPTVTHKLIQKGADLNARDAEDATPLHYAVKSRDNNNEIVHLLLYYGADVSTKCCKTLHPFGHALFAHKFELALILANYYDVEHLREDVNLFFVHDALSVLNLIPLDVLKLIWPLLDRCSFEKVPLFMRNYLCLYKHTNLDWIEGMYMILESDYASEIINGWTSRSYSWSFNLLNAFDKRQIAPHDRLAIIYKFLNTSIELHVSDLCYIYDVCGFNEIFEATLYCGSFCDGEHDPCIDMHSPIDTFLLVRDENYKIETTSKLFKNMLLLSSRHFRKSNRMLNALNYFSLPLYVKYELLEICKKTFISEEYEQIATKLQSVPEMPTLIELCRNAVRTCVKPKQLRQLYHFYDNVNKLELPSKLRDIIIFKASPF